jgi:excisionase family DNA binding protein
MQRREAPDGVRVTLNVREAAQISGYGERTIRKGIKAGLIPHLGLGRNIVIPRAAFLRWIDSAGDSAK